MTDWHCRLDETSLERFRRELDLPNVVNRVETPGEWDLPRCQVQERAMDALRMLAMQAHPDLDRARLRALLDELHLICEPDRKAAQ